MLWKTMAWSSDLLRAVLVRLAEGCLPKACARVMGLITVHLDPAHFTPRGNLILATCIGVMSARRAFL